MFRRVLDALFGKKERPAQAEEADELTARAAKVRARAEAVLANHRRPVSGDFEEIDARLRRRAP